MCYLLHAGAGPVHALNPVRAQVMEGLGNAFTAVEALSSGSQGDFDQELLLVHLLHNLVSLGHVLWSSARNDDLSSLQGDTCRSGVVSMLLSATLDCLPLSLNTHVTYVCRSPEPGCRFHVEDRLVPLPCTEQRKDRPRC